MEHQTGNCLNLIEENFIHFISMLVIIFVHTIEIKDDRNIILGEVVVVGTVIKLVRIVGFVVSVVELKFSVLVVGQLVYLVQVSAEPVRPDYVHIVLVVFVFL